MNEPTPIRFALRIDLMLNALFAYPETILGVIDSDPLLNRRERPEDGIRLANASKRLFTPQGQHHLYAKGIVYQTDPLQVVSVPYLKMYNYGEREEPAALAHELAARPDVTIRFNEKLDGSMIQSFVHEGKVILTTRGMIEGSVVAGEDSENYFDYLGTARRMLREQAPASLDPKQVEGLTLLWELIHPEARIVTDYGDREQLVLTGALDHNEARYLPRNELEVLAADLACPLAPELPLTGDTLEERLQALEGYLAGTDREGSVLTFEGPDCNGRLAVLHRVKVKGADYIRLMRMMTHCNYNAARDILEANPDLRSWFLFRTYLEGLGTTQVPEEVLSSWQEHYDAWEEYKGHCEALAGSVRAWFASYCIPRPLPDKEADKAAYGLWRRDFASLVSSMYGKHSWLFFLAADGRISGDAINAKIKGDREALTGVVEGLIQIWTAFNESSD